MFVALEHANLTVRDGVSTARFLMTAFPEFYIRGRSDLDEAQQWLHVGTDESYVALYYSGKNTNEICYAGFNHLGYVVTDVEDLRIRLLDAGYREGFKAAPHPWRKRIYILDDDGIEWEFVEYLSDDPTRRNDYTA